MTEANGMIERAAKAMYDAFGEGSTVSYRRMALRGLLAALDPEDKAAIERVAKRICVTRHPAHDVCAMSWAMGRDEYVAEARAAINALKSIVQGGPLP